MDEIFHRTTNPFNIVKIAHEMPHRYDKYGNLLIAYEETEEGQMYAERRRSSIAAQQGTQMKLDADQDEKTGAEHREI